MRIFGMRRIGNKTGSWVALTFYDRLSGLISLLSLTFLCLIFSPLKERIPRIYYMVSMISLAGICMIACCTALVAHNNAIISNSKLFQFKGAAKFKSLFTGFTDHQYRVWRKWALFISFSLLYHSIGAVTITIIARDILPAVSLVDWCWIMGVTSILTLLPLSVGGLGIREAGFVGILYLLGFPREPAIAVSLIIYAIQMTGAITGAILNLISSKTVKAALE